MNATQSPLVLETLDCLMAIAASDLAPADASQRLRGVREAFPDIKLDLLWDQGDAGPTCTMTRCCACRRAARSR